MRWLLLITAEAIAGLTLIVLTWLWAWSCFSHCPDSLRWKTQSLIVGGAVLLYFVTALAIPIRMFLRLSGKQFYLAIVILYLIALPIAVMVDIEPFGRFDRSLLSKEAWREEFYGSKFLEQEATNQFKEQYTITYPTYFPSNVSPDILEEEYYSSLERLTLVHECMGPRSGILSISHTPVERKSIPQGGPQRAPNGNEVENVIVQTEVLGREALFVETYQYRFHDSTRGRLEYIVLYWEENGMQKRIDAEQCDVSQEDLVRMAESMK
ncbi:MAG: hypothetical protein AAB524_02945 [Patescibacteria group bacterium]